MFSLRFVLLVLALSCWGSQDARGFYVIPYGYGDAYRPPTTLTPETPPVVTSPPVGTTPPPPPPVVTEPPPTAPPLTAPPPTAPPPTAPPPTAPPPTMPPPTIPPPTIPPTTPPSPPPPPMTPPTVPPPVVKLCNCPSLPVPPDQEKIVLKCQQYCNYFYPNGEKVPIDNIPDYLKGNLQSYSYTSEPNFFGQTSIMISSNLPTNKYSLKPVRFPSGPLAASSPSIIYSSIDIPALAPAIAIKDPVTGEIINSKQNPIDNGSNVQKDIVTYLSDPNAFGQAGVSFLKTNSRGIFGNNLPKVKWPVGASQIQPVYNPWLDPLNLRQPWINSFNPSVFPMPNMQPVYSVVL